MSQEEDRAYREGQVNERLRGHDEHLKRINGSIERTAHALEEVARKSDRMDDKLTGLLLVMPKIQTVAEKQLQAEEVAEALKQKHLDEQTAWDRWRNIVAWSLGSVIALVTISNLILRVAGIG
jgi:hypothetical protein